MAQATNRATVVIDGERLRSKAGASMQVGGVRRETRMDDQGQPYYVETVVPGMIKCTMPHMADTDLQKIRNFKNGTVQYETDTGAVYTMPDSVCAEIGDLSNGEVEVTFTGNQVK